jgi:WD40 repeat protein
MFKLLRYIFVVLFCLFFNFCNANKANLIAFSSDGELILAGPNLFNYMGVELEHIYQGVDLCSVSISRNKRLVAFGTKNSEILIYDVSYYDNVNIKEIRKKYLITPIKDGEKVVEFIVSSNSFERADYFLEQDCKAISALVFSPDSTKILFNYSLTQDLSSVYLVDLRSEMVFCLSQFSYEHDLVSSDMFSDNGAIVVSSRSCLYEDYSLTLYDKFGPVVLKEDIGTEIFAERFLGGHKGTILMQKAVHFMGGTWLELFEDGIVNTNVFTPRFDYGTRILDVSADGKKILLNVFDDFDCPSYNEIILFDIETKEIMMLKDREEEFLSGVFGKMNISRNRVVVIFRNDLDRKTVPFAHVRVWDLDCGQCIKQENFPDLVCWSNFQASISPDCYKFAILDDNLHVAVYSI